MELNQSITSSSSSSSSSFQPHVNPDPADDDDVTFRFNPQQQDDAEDDDVTFRFNLQQQDNDDAEDDDVTFRLNHLQIHSNHSSGEPSHQPAADADDVTFQIDDIHDNNNQQQDAEYDDVSFNVNKTDDSHNDNQQEDAEEVSDVSFGTNNKTDDNHNNSTDDDDDDDVDDDGDFTFMYVGDNNNSNNINNNTESPDADVSGDGQIRKVFPLFDQSLLLNVDSDDVKRRLPIDVPVDNVFIESPRQSPSTNGQSNGTVTALPKESNNNNNNNNNIKSNSTGFSKLWRFRNNEMNRSNSDGRDAFVFLEATTSDGKSKGVAEKGVKKKSKASAHEVYLKQKGGQAEEDRKRSYLPYRPGLMGFFTNVNGGLSKNVHPF